MCEVFAILSVCQVFLIFAAVTSAQESTTPKNPSKSGRKSIKGEQFLRQTMAARVKNGPIPQNVLNLLLDNTANDTNITSRGEDSRVTPMLITDNVKTTVTRVEIPLSTIYMDSEWYKTTLKKFLLKNKINISNSSSLESPDNSMPNYDDILYKLNTALRLRNNIITTFGLLLQNTKALKLLPPGHHPSLSLIYQLLKLRRIPVIGMLENLDKLTGKKNLETYIIIFSELWEAVPKYIMSCPTLWLESLQDGSVVNEHFLNTFLPKGNLLSGLPENDTILQTPLLFSKATLQHISRDHEVLFGKTMAAILSGIAQGAIPLRAPLFIALLLHFPLNKPVFEDLDILTLTEITDEEERVFQEAIQELRPSFIKASLKEMFKSVLSKILKFPNFEGREKYEEFLKCLESPSEDFIYHQISSFIGGEDF